MLNRLKKNRVNILHSINNLLIKVSYFVGSENIRRLQLQRHYQKFIEVKALKKIIMCKCKHLSVIEEKQKCNVKSSLVLEH